LKEINGEKKGNPAERKSLSKTKVGGRARKLAKSGLVQCVMKVFKEGRTVRGTVLLEVSMARMRETGGNGGDGKSVALAFMVLIRTF